MNSEKFCKDCKHVRAPWYDWILFGYRYAKCSAFPNKSDFSINETDKYRVTGRRFVSIEAMDYCTVARKYDNLCGPDATKFEPRE